MLYFDFAEKQGGVVLWEGVVLARVLYWKGSLSQRTRVSFLCVCNYNYPRSDNQTHMMTFLSSGNMEYRSPRYDRETHDMFSTTYNASHIYRKTCKNICK